MNLSNFLASEAKDKAVYLYGSKRSIAENMLISTTNRIFEYKKRKEENLTQGIKERRKKYDEKKKKQIYEYRKKREKDKRQIEELRSYLGKKALRGKPNLSVR